MPAGDECLGAVDDPVVAVTHRRRAHTREVRPGSRFGHRDGGEQRPVGQAGEPALALFVVRVVQEVRQDHLELGADRRQRHQRPRRLLLQHDVVAVVGHAGAAVLLGNRHPEHPERTHPLEDVARHSPGLLPLWVGGHDLLLDEVAGQLPERLVVFGEQVSAHEFPRQATSSTSVALAVPPPSHMVCNP